MILLHSLYELLNRECTFNIYNYYIQTFNAFDMNFHKHPSFEIMYIVKGACEISYKLGSKTLTTHLKQGYWIFIDANIPHSLTVLPNTPCKISNLEVSLLASDIPLSSTSIMLKKSPNFLRFLEAKQSVVLFDSVQENEQIYESLHNIHTYLSRSPLYTPLESETLLIELEINKLLLILAHHYSIQSNDSAHLYYIQKAMYYIDEYFDHEITITNLAKYVGISPAYLQRLFAKQFNTTIFDYVTHKRIDKAILLLKTSKLTILDIALECGFNSRQHFTHTFKKVKGLSPHQFRVLKNTYEIPF